MHSYCQDPIRFNNAIHIITHRATNKHNQAPIETTTQNTFTTIVVHRLRNDLYCVEWGVKLYSLTHSLTLRYNESHLTYHQVGTTDWLIASVFAKKLHQPINPVIITKQRPG